MNVHESLLPLGCPHPDKCGQEGCHGCQEPVTSRMKTRVVARSCRICGERFDAPIGDDAVKLATADLALHMDGHTREQIVRVYVLGEPWWKVGREA